MASTFQDFAVLAVGAMAGVGLGSTAGGVATVYSSAVSVISGAGFGAG
jgi:hypothetical protein